MASMGAFSFGLGDGAALSIGLADEGGAQSGGGLQVGGVRQCGAESRGSEGPLRNEIAAIAADTHAQRRGDPAHRFIGGGKVKSKRARTAAGRRLQCMSRQCMPQSLAAQRAGE